MAFDWFKKLFSSEKQTPQAIIQQMQNDQIAEWNLLFSDIKKNMHKSPDDPEVQILVDRWETLMKRNVHENNISKVENTQTMIVPEGIREYAAEFADPSAFIQKAIAYRYKNQPALVIKK